MPSVLDDSIKNAMKRTGRFVIQPGIDNNGSFEHYENSLGMQESLLWPIAHDVRGNPIVECNKGELIYLFGMGGIGFEPTPGDLVDALTKLSEIKENMDAWLTAWGVPPGFAGDIHLDDELFSLFSSGVDADPDKVGNFAAQYPGMTWQHGVWYFYNEVCKSVKEERPAARFISEWGMGGVNPNYMIWHFGSGPDGGVPIVPDPSDTNPVTFQSYIKTARANSFLFNPPHWPWAVSRTAYDSHWSSGWTREQRKTILLRGEEILKATFGSRFYREGSTTFSTLRSQRSDRPYESLTLEEFDEIFSDSLALGHRRFGIWDSLRNSVDRDQVQEQILNVLVPTIQKYGGTVTGYATQAEHP